MAIHTSQVLQRRGRGGLDSPPISTLTRWWVISIAKPVGWWRSNFSCDEEIAALVQTRWFDTVTVCVSDVFTRSARIDALAVMI